MKWEVGVEDKDCNEDFSVIISFRGASAHSRANLIYSIRNIEENLGPEWLIIEQQA
jgi:hypothetical protein